MALDLVEQAALCLTFRSTSGFLTSLARDCGGSSSKFDVYA